MIDREASLDAYIVVLKGLKTARNEAESQRKMNDQVVEEIKKRLYNADREKQPATTLREMGVVAPWPRFTRIASTEPVAETTRARKAKGLYDGTHKIVENAVEMRREYVNEYSDFIDG